MEQPGPEFGGRKQFHGVIVDHGERDSEKFVIVDFQTAYDLPELTRARRTLTLNPQTGAVTIHDSFSFAGDPLPVEESFVTWDEVTVEGASSLIIRGQHNAIRVTADGAAFKVEELVEESRVNERPGAIKRISTVVSGTEFELKITPL